MIRSPASRGTRTSSASLSPRCCVRPTRLGCAVCPSCCHDLRRYVGCVWLCQLWQREWDLAVCAHADLQLWSQIADYCVEMTWSFKSWLPLVNRVLPTDDVTMWKRGSSMRMDTTLLGFSGMKWKRGQ